MNNQIETNEIQQCLTISLLWMYWVVCFLLITINTHTKLKKKKKKFKAFAEFIIWSYWNGLNTVAVSLVFDIWIRDTVLNFKVINKWFKKFKLQQICHTNETIFLLLNNSTTQIHWMISFACQYVHSFIFFYFVCSKIRLLTQQYQPKTKRAHNETIQYFIFSNKKRNTRKS